MKILFRNLTHDSAFGLAKLLLRLIPDKARAGLVQDRFSTVGAVLGKLPRANIAKEVARAISNRAEAVPWWALRLVGVPKWFKLRQSAPLSLANDDLSASGPRQRARVRTIRVMIGILKVLHMTARRLEGVSCIVFGSVNIDFVLKVADSWQTSSSTQSWGGKAANAGVALAKLGARPTLIVRVGDDSLGRGALRHFASEGMVLGSNKPDARMPTGVSVAVKGIDKEGKKTFAMYGALNVNLEIGNEEHNALELAMRAAERPPPLLLQLEIPIEPMLRAMDLARQHGAPICLRASPLRNAKQVKQTGVLSMLEAGVSMLFVTPPEGKALLGALGVADVQMPTTVKDAEIMAAQLLARYPAMWAVQISFLGDRKASPPVAGAHILCERPGWSMATACGTSVTTATTPKSGGEPTPFHVLTSTILNDPREVDATGANDAFFGAFMAAAMRGAASSKCLLWACAAYYLTTFHHGAQASPTVTELEFFLGCQEIPVLEQHMAIPMHE